MPVVSKPVYRICDTNDDSRRYNTQVHLNLTDQKIKINSAFLDFFIAGITEVFAILEQPIIPIFNNFTIIVNQ